MARIRHIDNYDMVNGFFGVCVSLWFQGCEHKCLGCFNKETWDKDLVKDRSNKEIVHLVLNALDFYFEKDLSILGGDPFANFNVDDLFEILLELKISKPNLKIAIWTGYTFEDILKDFKKKRVLELIDILVDGIYVNNLKTDYKVSKDCRDKFRGSLNQRIIDVRKTLSNKLNIIYYDLNS